MAEEVKADGGEDQVVKDGKVLAIFAYLGILFLIPLLAGKDNKFALHHGKQGLIIFLAWIAAMVIGIIPFIGWILVPFLMLALVVISIIGIVQVLQGNYWKAPLIYQLSQKFKI